MSAYNGNRQQERRRNRLFTPLIYFFAELTLAWLILSIINFSFNITVWAKWSYLALFIVSLYSLKKTLRVYRRQKKLKRA
jgi:hypothetical protein